MRQSWKFCQSLLSFSFSYTLGSLGTIHGPEYFYLLWQFFFKKKTKQQQQKKPGAQFQPQWALITGRSEETQLQTSVILHQTTRGGGTTCFIPSGTTSEQVCMTGFFFLFFYCKVHPDEDKHCWVIWPGSKSWAWIQKKKKGRGARWTH